MGQDKAPIGEWLEHLDEAARLDDGKWRDLVASGNRRAQALGLTEDDLPRLITEARRERHAG